MKKIYYLLLLSTSFLSCQKNINDVTQPHPLNVSANSAVIQSTTTAIADTIPPSNATDVKTYGAKGDGVTDDSGAIQNAINRANVIVFSKGTYMINKTLILRSGVSIYGINGATIQAGPSMTGDLLISGRYFYLNSVSGSSLINLKFQPSIKNFSLGAWANAVIYIANSPNNIFKYNIINFKQAYAASGVEGFWVSGTGSINNQITYNTLNTVGIEYAEAGASYNTFLFNTIVNAHSDALSAHGNSTVYCTKNRVLYNRITNAGHMGIEDWGNVDGTQVRGNVINGTGKSPSEGTDGIGISLVGVNAVAVLNTISDAKLMYMEIGGNHNCRVDSNIIYDTAGLITGILVNFRSATPANAKSSGSSIGYNTIFNCLEGISVEGDYTPLAALTGNKINDPKYIGINVNSNSAFTVGLNGNVITYTKPNVQARNGIVVYSTKLSGAQITNVTGNTITYNTSANSGSAKEIALMIGVNNINYTGNYVYGNKIKAGGVPISAISSNGNNFSGITVLNNTFSGATVDLLHLIFKTNTGNTIL